MRRNRLTAFISIMGMLLFVLVVSGHSPARAAVSSAPTSPVAVCGQAVLNSPYSYAGAATSFTSGEFGLPTFGAAGTDYPSATTGIVVPAGNNASANWDAINNDNTVVYFEPGDHTNTNVSPGNNSAYLGGFTSALGEAAIDGTGQPGQTITSDNANVTFKYLTVKNFGGNDSNSSWGGSVLDEDGGNGWTVDYNTVGPNGNTLGNPNTGYGIGIGSDSTYEYNCVTQNGEGGFNNGTNTQALKDPSPWGGPANYTVDHNEISGNAIATDASKTVWNDNGGVAAGLKVFWSLNGTIDDNYVHDNYGEGLWPDTNNSGIDMSDNYMSNNMDTAITYEASFNANITDNTMVGNGWNPEGTKEWAGYPNGLQPTAGGGPDFADGAIFINNSGGSTGVLSGNSRYLGQMNITGNVLSNNFGGIIAFQDRNRFCGEGADGGDDTCTVNGTYTGQFDNNQNPVGNTPYSVTQTSYSDNATLTSGSTALTTGSAFTSNYDDMTAKPAAGWVVEAFNQNSGDPAPGILPAGETIASSASATSFTLSKPASASSSSTAIEIEASPPGGCGMANLSGTSEGNAYFENCNWWTQDLNVSGNSFSMVANPNLTFVPGEVTGVTEANGGGYMTLYASSGAGTNGSFFTPYGGSVSADRITAAVAKNVWANNTYSWSGPGSWTFAAGNQGNVVSQADWLGTYKQDVGSTFNNVPVPSPSPTTPTPTPTPTTPTPTPTPTVTPTPTPTPTGVPPFSFSAPASFKVSSIASNGYALSWQADLAGSRKPTNYTLKTFNANNVVVDEFNPAKASANEFGKGGTGLPAGVYRTYVWANGATLPSPYSEVTVTIP